MFKYFSICLCLLCFAVFSQSISNVDLKKRQLETALFSYYQHDTVKKEAAKFLISNIEIHYSENYKWVDEKRRTIEFNELDYPNFEIALREFQKLQDSIKITPQVYIVKDIDVVTPELLIKSIDQAFNAWKNYSWSKSYDFKTFCEYILPYRSLTEPLEDWRAEYAALIEKAPLRANKNEPADVATKTILELKNFRFLDTRPDPISYLSPKQLLFRREGACNDLANLTLLACRAIGLATTFDFTPEYGASSKRHFWDTIIDENGKHIPFNGNCFGNPQGLPYAYNATEKRLAKVFRKTFSIQSESLAAKKDSVLIPNGFLREKNILDVTGEYVPVGEISYTTSKINTETIAYLNVFNMSRWRVVEWGQKIDNQILYQNIGLNIVYLPSFYDPILKKMNFAPFPVLLGNDKKQQILAPNYNKTFSFNLSRDKTKKGPGLDFNSFEVFENEKYSLYVWDKGWKKIEEAIAERDHVHFQKIPDNGLFLVLCPKSNGYERIFVINNQTKQIEWY
ncbi:transglutaminase-like domain-containing protein [Flavobacterium sp. 17A]|uniref:Transglutaminase-like domain-containing protein n=1 Tax=Flavobacterium potami TaxID=2872310 RepID=A0A9X1KS81_9FLAO|nr:transglutaminase-like domain-containing protein [Flavobacterium potami]MBZ4036832.1 transglutaminase-like domain-containing protein [Flavobacterium potami]